jgi:ankyrin repeat protein
VEVLLKVPGVDVNQANKDEENTPLHFAAYNGDPEVVNWLIRKGAEVTFFFEKSSEVR